MSLSSMDRSDESPPTEKKKSVALIARLSDVLTRGKTSPLLGKDPPFSESVVNELFDCLESIRREWEEHLENVKGDYESRVQSLKKADGDGAEDWETGVRTRGGSTDKGEGKKLELEAELDSLRLKRDQSSVFFSINQERIVEEGIGMLVQHTVIAHLPEGLIIPWKERFENWDTCLTEPPKLPTGRLLVNLRRIFATFQPAFTPLYEFLIRMHLMDMYASLLFLLFSPASSSLFSMSPTAVTPAQAVEMGLQKKWAHRVLDTLMLHLPRSLAFSSLFPMFQPASPVWFRKALDYFFVELINRDGVGALLVQDFKEQRKEVLEILSGHPRLSSESIARQIMDIIDATEAFQKKDEGKVVLHGSFEWIEILSRMESRSEGIRTSFWVPLFSALLLDPHNKHYIVTEKQVERTVERIHCVIVAGRVWCDVVEDCMEEYFPVLKDLYIFSQQSVSVIKTRTKEILTRFVKMSSNAVQCLRECILPSAESDAKQKRKQFVDMKRVLLERGDGGGVSMRWKEEETDESLCTLEEKLMDPSISLHAECIITLLKESREDDVIVNFFVHVLKAFMKLGKRREENVMQSFLALKTLSTMSVELVDSLLKDIEKLLNVIQLVFSECNVEEESNQDMVSLCLALLEAIISSKESFSKDERAKIRELYPFVGSLRSQNDDVLRSMCSSLLLKMERATDETKERDEGMDFIFKLLESDQPHLRAMGIDKTKAIIRSRSDDLDIERVFLAISLQLEHSESYVYLCAVQCLSAMCEVYPEFTLQRLKSMWLSDEYSIPLRWKIAEVFIMMSARGGGISSSGFLMATFLEGVRNHNPDIRTCALSNIGELVLHVGVGAHAYLTEIIHACLLVLQTDRSAEARRGAAYALHEMIVSLGRQESLAVLEGLVDDIYAQLQITGYRDEDEATKIHARNAVSAMFDVYESSKVDSRRMEEFKKKLGIPESVYNILRK